jgi:hypothetical protein
MDRTRRIAKLCQANSSSWVTVRNKRTMNSALSLRGEQMTTDNKTCTCKHIKIRMSCYKCEYPDSEANVFDDGTDCGCTTCKETH